MIIDTNTKNIWRHDIFTIIFVGIVFPCRLFALEYSKDIIGFIAHSPPGRVYVQDSEGRVAGMDPSAPVDQWGGTKEISLIPNSEVEAQNIASDDEKDYGKPMDETGWFVYVGDRGRQKYTIVINGLKAGIQDIVVHSLEGMNDEEKCNIWIVPGKTRRIKVEFIPDGDPQIILIREASVTSLVESIWGAYEVGDIKTKAYLNILTGLSNSIYGDFNEHDRKKVINSISEFNSELMTNGNENVKEPSLSMLHEEIDALLKEIVNAKD